MISEQSKSVSYQPDLWFASGVTILAMASGEPVPLEKKHFNSEVSKYEQDQSYQIRD
jgi:hypothetical protein